MFKSLNFKDYLQHLTPITFQFFRGVKLNSVNPNQIDRFVFIDRIMC